MMLLRDGESTVAAVQLDAHGEKVSTWVVPIPGELQGSPPMPKEIDNIYQIDAGSFETILAASDPTYLSNAENKLACGCNEGMSDTGEASAVRFFDPSVAFDRDVSQFFGPDQTVEALTAIEAGGVDVNDAVQNAVSDYAAKGWSLLVVNTPQTMTSDQSFPLLAYRYAGTDVVVPLALSAESGGDEMQVVVVLVDKGRMDPSTSEGVEPKLGQPMYRSEFTRQFYNARVRLAIEQAGGHAWVLEYANTLDALQVRFNESGGMSEESSEEQLLSYSNVDEIFDALKSKSVTSPSFSTRGLFVTRWRTFVASENMQDEEFSRSENDETYEVTLGEDDFRDVSSALFITPLLVMGWAYRRRELLRDGVSFRA